MSVPVSMIDRKHVDYLANAASWDRYEALNRGGEALKTRAAEFLVARPKEPNDGYTARCKRFVYTNLLSTIIGWYIAKLFRREPEVDLAVADASGAPAGDLSEQQNLFLQAFLANADQRQTTFVDVLRKVAETMLVYKSAYVLLDLRQMLAEEFRNRAEQLAAGALDPYVCVYKPCQVINWSNDDHGNLEWAVLFSSDEERSFMDANITVERWTYYTRSEFSVYERRFETGAKEKPEFANLVDGPKAHMLARENRLPLYRIEVPDTLWLANRAYLPLLDYLNTENGLAWALMNGNLAAAVIIGEVDVDSLRLSEIGAYILPTGSTFSYAEQSGNCFTISMSRLEQIREEIYRASYLMSQGRSAAATPAAQSGYAKEQDMAPAHDVLNCYGDILRAAMQRILVDVGQARQYGRIAADVRGFTFEGEDPMAELELIERAAMLNVPSDTLDKELLKKASRLLLADSNLSLIQKVMDEIDQAPSREARQQMAMQQEQDRMAGELGAALNEGAR